MRQNIREWIKAVGAAVAMAVIIIQFVIPTTVYGVSMEPNFEPNDYLLVNRLAYDDHRKPERGEVVVFSSHLKDKNGEDKMLIKRVVGLPGETVEVRDGMVYI
ncbi:MAG: signal peptidase I, partial [Emergencia sp.]